MRSPALLLALAACAFEPPTDRPLEPPAAYRVIWNAAQACTGRTGDFEQLRFFAMTKEEAGPYRLGTTWGRDIFLRDDMINDSLVVKHEMIHALGVKGHPHVPFVNPCRAML